MIQLLAEAGIGELVFIAVIFLINIMLRDGALKLLMQSVKKNLSEQRKYMFIQRNVCNIRNPELD